MLIAYKPPITAHNVATPENPEVAYAVAINISSIKNRKMYAIKAPGDPFPSL